MRISHFDEGEYEAPEHPMVDANAKEIVRISRAEELVSCSDFRRFKDALLQAFPELTEADRR